MSRALKSSILALLESPGWRARLSELDAWPVRQAVGPLFSALLNRNPEVPWRAVAAFGHVLPRLADADMESARVLMRRLIWNLSEESGNLGWGMPEVMGEACASHPRLAGEYHCILLSYIQGPEREGNFIEHGPLRRGAYWGIARLAEARPALAAPAVPDLILALAEEDPASRGLAALALGRILGSPARQGGCAALPDPDADALTGRAVSALHPLTQDPASFPLFRADTLADTTVGGLVQEALDRIG